MKLLSPAGNLQSLKMAVYNGADEVYLGINDFNARNNIDGFTLDTLKQAVDFAHIYGVKVCLAINILFKDDELQKALDSVVKAYNYGVDYFIVQDIGLAKLIRDNYKNIVLHASTQMAIHNLEGVRFLEQFGFKRVVVARETPLSEVKRIRQNSNIEIEYFCHGALCVSFSGNCYLSSYLHDASGNRGKCKQLCRLPYTLQKGDKVLKKGYLLSAKDFDMLDKLSELKECGVDVLKIEGRARRPYYVAVTTKAYRDTLDNKKIDRESISLAFNRGFTSGYLNGNGNVISKTQNHIGIKIGTVLKVECGKRFNRVFISTTRELTKKSTFKFFDGQTERAVISAFDLVKVGVNKYALTTTTKVCVGDIVHLISDYQAEETTLKLITKRKINLSLWANCGEKITASFSVFDKEYIVEGSICERAKNQPLTIADFKENFVKNDYFDFEFVHTEIADVFMSKKDLNEFRRTVVNRVIDALTTPFYRTEEPVKVHLPKAITPQKDVCFINNLNEEITGRIAVYSPDEYTKENVQKFIDKCQKVGVTPYLDTPNFALEKDVALLKEIVSSLNVGVIANNYYGLTVFDNILIGGGLNVYNSISASVFDLPFITAEWDNGSKINYPYMTLRHCPMKSHLNATCDKCPYENGYIYKTESGKTLKLSRKKLSTCTFYLTE